MNDWLFAGGVTNLAVMPVYAYVGTRLYERPVPSRARLPSAQFAIWWWGLGGTGVLSGLEGILWSIGALSFPLAFTMYLVLVLADCVILWGLVGYLLYIYTGKSHLLELTGFYAVFYVSVLYYITASGPNGVALSASTPGLTYAHMISGPVVDFVVLGLVFPELIASILYLTLIFRTKDRTLRYRIGMVSAAIFLFFAGAILTPSGGPALQVWSLVTGLIDAGAALLALFAFFPPVAIQRAWGVTAVPREEVRAGPEDTPV